jgi:arylsulfatase A-like enzyme
MVDGRCQGRAGSELAAASAFVALLAALAWGCGAAPAGPGAPVRNVVLVSLDTLRADHLGLYGHARDTSPELDAFAREAYVFERALAPAPNTPPSQMSMMTSLYPGRHGFTGKETALAEGIETLAGRLQEAGLRTVGFVDGAYLRGFFGFDRGFDRYDDEGGGFAAILPKAERWLEAHDDEPFFLFLHTYDVHAPYVSPPPYAGMFHERPYTGDLVPTSEAIDRIWREKIALPAEDMQHLVDSYDEGIRYTDAMLGGFLRRLAERGRLDDTLVIVTSDHGEEFGEHGSVNHWQLYYQPNLRVPLVVRPPGGVDGPLRASAQAELIDLLPTVLELVGAEPLAAAQGRSLVPEMAALREGAPALRDAPDRAALAWWPDPDQLPLRSLVQDGHQLLFNHEVAGFDQLYDLAADPMALRDVAAEQPERAARLREIGLRGLSESTPVPGVRAPPRMKIDRRTLEQLEALGYRQ